MLQDLRFAARLFRKNPAFTGVAIGALALGIGATTAVFSVVNSILIQPLPFPDPDRLVMVWERPPTGKLTNVVLTQNFLDWRKRNRSFQDIAAIFSMPMNLAGEGEPVQVPGLRITAGFFEILGVSPFAGRTIRADEDVPGAPGVVLLGYGLWQRHYGGRPDVLGQKILINGSRCEVIGVMPPGFDFPTLRADVFIPMQIDPVRAGRDGRNDLTIARLRPNISVRDAQADMESVAAQLAREHPQMNARWSAMVVPLKEQTVGEARTTLLVLFGAVISVLLIACANVANLLLMRASTRQREMTVRVALGAGRWHLLRQLLAEGLTLAFAGGVLGFVLAYWGVPALIRILPTGFPLPRMREIAVNRSVLEFALLVSAVCGILFGILPAFQVNRARIAGGLSQAGRSATSSNRRLRGALVVIELAVAVLLVVGGGLMLRSFLLLHAIDPGFRPEHVLTFRMMLLFSKYGPHVPRRAAVIEDILARVRALPMVTSASSIHLLPMTGMQSGTGYFRVDHPAPEPGTIPGGDVSVISEDYFRTMGIPLVAGRDFDTHDRMGSRAVGILNQRASHQIFPGENPLGKHLKVWWNLVPEVEIVGVAGDVHHNGLDKAPRSCLFLANAQTPNLWSSLVIRTKGDPLAAAAAVKARIHSVDPAQGIQEIQTMEAVVSDSIAPSKLRMAILAVFAAIALVLACMGIYAVFSYSVEQRLREIGVRLALGAVPASILHMVLREGVSLAVAGIATGVLAALALTRYLAALLYEVRPTDLSVYAAVSAVVMVAALAGCYFPARRATRVDPAVVLREE